MERIERVRVLRSRQYDWWDGKKVWFDDLPFWVQRGLIGSPGASELENAQLMYVVGAVLGRVHGEDESWDW